LYSDATRESVGYVYGIVGACRSATNKKIPLTPDDVIPRWADEWKTNRAAANPARLAQEVDAVILAAAGVCRMGMAGKMHQFMDVDLMLPAVAQGTLGIQTRDADDKINGLVDQMNDPETVIRTRAERSFLARLEGGCQVPIAAFATLDGEQLLLKGLVGDVNGDVVIAREIEGLAVDAKQMGIALADEILDAGARPILEALYALEAK